MLGPRDSSGLSAVWACATVRQGWTTQGSKQAGLYSLWQTNEK